MEHRQLLTKLISKGENRNAAALLQKIREENTCPEYADALEKILLTEAAKLLNDSVSGFYRDTQALAAELFSENPPDVRAVIDSLCNDVRDAARENNNRAYEKALFYIRKKLSDNQLSLGGAAEYAGISQSGLVKLFTENAGMTPGEFLGRERVLKSLKILEDGMSVGQAALSVGFSSTEAYIRAFKRVMKTTPGEWKRNKLFL